MPALQRTAAVSAACRQDAGVTIIMIAEITNISKHYQRGNEFVRAIHDISFTIQTGEMIALVGPSGCGKTTCLNLIAGVDRPDDGDISICGNNLRTASEAALVHHRRRCIGMVFQSFYLMPHLTVEENITLPLSLDGKRNPERIRDLIDRVGLSHRITHYPSELSGGEQQRTAVARALVHKPSILLADEPTGNLDSHSGQAILELMNGLRCQEGSALLMATHDERIAAMADRIIHLRDGLLETIEQK